MGFALVMLIVLFFTIMRVLILFGEMLPNEWSRIKRKAKGYKRPIIVVPVRTCSKWAVFGAGLIVGIIGCIILGVALKLTLILGGIFLIGLLFGRLAKPQ